MNTFRLIALWVLLGLVAACAGRSTSGSVQSPSGEGFAGALAPTEAPAATQAPEAFVDEAGAGAPEAVLLATAAPGEEAALQTGGGGGQLAYAAAGSRMVIKDAELEVLVQDTGLAILQVTQMAADYDGYIISSQTWYDQGFQFASLRLGVPSNRFENVLNRMRGLGLRVLRENASGQDVSAEYVDLQSRLTNLEATAARVRDFLADAKTVEESLRISGQLSELEAQIEQVKGQMRFYEGRAAFSTVTVYLTPEFPTPTPTYTPSPTPTPTATPTLTPTPAWNAGETFDEASGVLGAMSRSSMDLLIWVAVVGGPPGLLVLAVTIMLRRRLRGLPDRIETVPEEAD